MYTKSHFYEHVVSGLYAPSASRYLDALVGGGILKKQKIGRTNYYINTKLFRILAGEAMTDGEDQ